MSQGATIVSDKEYSLSQKQAPRQLHRGPMTVRPMFSLNARPPIHHYFMFEYNELLNFRQATVYCALRTSNNMTPARLSLVVLLATYAGTLSHFKSSLRNVASNTYGVWF